MQGYFKTRFITHLKDFEKNTYNTLRYFSTTTILKVDEDEIVEKALQLKYTEIRHNEDYVRGGIHLKALSKVAKKEVITREDRAHIKENKKH
jgi:hypothetical protein